MSAPTPSPWPRPRPARRRATSPANAALGADLVRRAGGARVVVLPELFLSAYHPPTLYARRRRGHPRGGRRGGRGGRPAAGPAPGGRAATTRRWSSSAPRWSTPTAAGRVRPLWSVHRGRSSRPTTSRTSGGRTSGPCSAPAPAVPRWSSTAGGSGSASATTAACPSMPGPRRWPGAHALPLPVRLPGRLGAPARHLLRGPRPGQHHVRRLRQLRRRGRGAAVQRWRGDLRPGGAGARPRRPTTGEAVVTAVLDPAELTRVRARHTMLLDRPPDAGAERAVVRV